jgi:hypothetical protein
MTFSSTDKAVLDDFQQHLRSLMQAQGKRALSPSFAAAAHHDTSGLPHSAPGPGTRGCGQGADGCVDGPGGALHEC